MAGPKITVTKTIIAVTAIPASSSVQTTPIGFSTGPAVLLTAEVGRRSDRIPKRPKMVAFEVITGGGF
jgi:hypothetical protein